MRLISPPIVMLLLAVALAAPLPSVAQELTVSCTVSLPGVSAPPVEFGLAAAASAGIDALDEPLPPAAPGQALQVYLTMPASPAPGLDQWRREIRPFLVLATDRVAVWTMTVEHAQVGAAMLLATGLSIVDAPPYSLKLLGDAGLELPVAPGEDVTIPCTAEMMTFHWELTYDEQVPSAPHSWGGVKASLH